MNENLPRPGQVYRHIEGITYKIICISADVTGYEKTGSVGAPVVIYEQLDAGHYPAGTIWPRKLDDFMSSHNGTPIFQLIGE